MRFFSLFLLSALLVAPFFFASAQIPDGNSLEIVVNPEFPEPGSVVTLSLSTFSFDIDAADISWRVGGVAVLQGVGQKNLRVFLGEAGEETAVSVSVVSGLGASFERRVTIRPASVDIVAEPLTYTPPPLQRRRTPYLRGTGAAHGYPTLGGRGRARHSLARAHLYLV